MDEKFEYRARGYNALFNLAVYESNIRITCKIPAIPHALVNWITCLSLFVTEREKYGQVWYQFGDHKPFENIDARTNINRLMFRGVYREVIPELMQTILTFRKFEPALKSYRAALSDLEKLYNYYSSHRPKNGRPEKLIQYVSDEYRSDLFYARQFKKMKRARTQERKDFQHYFSGHLHVFTKT